MRGRAEPRNTVPRDSITWRSNWQLAAKLLKSCGQILILDLLKHNFDKARELYGDRWLGFAESDLHHWLEKAGFKKIEVSIVAREEHSPHFQTILAVGEK